jgi:hypothetical protein
MRKFSRFFSGLQNERQFGKRAIQVLCSLWLKLFACHAITAAVKADAFKLKGIPGHCARHALFPGKSGKG